VKGGIAKQPLQGDLLSGIGISALDEDNPHAICHGIPEVEVVIKGHGGIVGSDDGMDGTRFFVSEPQHSIGGEPWPQVERADGRPAPIDVQAQGQVVHGTLRVVDDADMEDFTSPRESHRGIEPG